MLFSFGPFVDAAEVQLLHVGVHFGAAGDDEGRDLDLVPLEDVGREDHVGDLAAGAGADVGAVELHVAAVVGGVLVVRAVRLGDHAAPSCDRSHSCFVGVLRVRVVGEDFPVRDGCERARTYWRVFSSTSQTPFLPPASMAMLVSVMRSSSVSDCDALAGEVHRLVGRAVDADLADDGEDQVLGGQVRRDLRRGR